MGFCSDEVLESAKQELIRAASRWKADGANVARGRVWDINGVNQDTDHSACHSWVNRAFDGRKFGGWGTGGKPTSNFLILTCGGQVRTKDAGNNQESREALVKWIARESPVSQFILNKDDESLVNGGLVIACGPGGANHNQCLWACKVLRMCIEAGQAVDTWHTLVTNGVNPNLALLVACHIRSYKNGVFSYTGVHSHSCVFHEPQIVGVKNFKPLLDGTLNPDAQNTSTVLFPVKATGWSEVKYDWDRGTYKDGNKVIDKLKGFGKTIKKPDGWGGFITQVGCETDEFVKAIKKWQQEIEGVESSPVEPVITRDTVYLDADI